MKRNTTRKGKRDGEREKGRESEGQKEMETERKGETQTHLGPGGIVTLLKPQRAPITLIVIHMYPYGPHTAYTTVPLL